MYLPIEDPNECVNLCSNHNKFNYSENCCDTMASCTCGTYSGHYSCMCPVGYYGSGFSGNCQRINFNKIFYFCTFSILYKLSIKF